MSSESQWVTFKIADETFGFEIQFVKEMLRLPEVYPVPHAAPDNLGVILLRKQIIPVFDLPKRFNMKSGDDKALDLITLLQDRQKDHENWIKELEASVVERREFTLTTDPHACKFGKWYDTFTSDNIWLSRVLKLFDAPHKHIHHVGSLVKEHQARQEYDEAMKLINTTRRTTLMELINLFGEAVGEVKDHSRRSLIVVGTSSCTIGIAVDAIDAVTACNDDDIQPADEITSVEKFAGLIGLLPQKGSEKCIMLLDPAELYPQLIGRQQSVAEMTSVTA